MGLCGAGSWLGPSLHFRLPRARAAGAAAGLPLVAQATRSGDLAQLLRLSQRLQLLQRLVLDLADALTGHVERAPDLIQRPRMLATEAIAQLQHSPLPVGEVLERLAQGFLGEQVRGPIEGGLGLLVGDELTELRLLLVADRLLERDRRLSGALDRVDLLRLDAGDVGDLLRSGLATE